MLVVNVNKSSIFTIKNIKSKCITSTCRAITNIMFASINFDPEQSVMDNVAMINWSL